MNVGIASDHRGYNTKQKLTNYLNKKGYNVIDYGTTSNESVDYPDYAFKLCEAINNGDVHFGITICGTGIGMSIACNKVNGIRCAKVCNDIEAKLSREHNDANVVSVSAKLSFSEIKDIIDTFLSTNFSEDERHLNRIAKISAKEESYR